VNPSYELSCRVRTLLALFILLFNVQRKLEADPRLTKVLAVPDAYVPVMKCVFDGIELDIVYAQLGVPVGRARGSNRNWCCGLCCRFFEFLFSLKLDYPFSVCDGMFCAFF